MYTYIYHVCIYIRMKHEYICTFTYIWIHIRMCNFNFVEYVMMTFDLQHIQFNAQTAGIGHLDGESHRISILLGGRLFLIGVQPRSLNCGWCVGLSGEVDIPPSSMFQCLIVYPCSSCHVHETFDTFAVDRNLRWCYHDNTSSTNLYVDLNQC